jgi:hypothetical protein
MPMTAMNRKVVAVSIASTNTTVASGPRMEVHRGLNVRPRCAKGAVRTSSLT